MSKELELLKDVIDAIEVNKMAALTWCRIRDDIINTTMVFITDKSESYCAEGWIEDAEPKVETADEVSKRLVSGCSQVEIAWDFVSLADALVEILARYHDEIEEILTENMAKTIHNIYRHIVLLSALDFDTDMTSCTEIVAHCRFQLERVFSDILAEKRSDDYSDDWFADIRKALLKLKS